MQKTLINRKDTENVKRFGVEFELYNVDANQLVAALQLKGIDCTIESYNHQTRNHWKLTTDSSIRPSRDQEPGRACYELVSPPLNGMTGLKQLRDVCLAMYFCDVKVNKTCGLHVHHEINHLNGEFQPITNDQKNNLLNMYARMENTIDAFMPVSRKRNNNRYCRSMIDAYHSAQGYGGLQYLGRYNKLNFESIDRHGTIEFRQHSGTIEFEKVYYWICFTANFVHNLKDIRSRSAMNYVERAWVPKRLKLTKRVWTYFKARIKQLDDQGRAGQSGSVLAA